MKTRANFRGLSAVAGLLCVAWFGPAAGAQPQTSKAIGALKTQDRLLLEYRGDFGSGKTFRLTLEKAGTTVSGDYFYAKPLKDIPLEGEFITERDLVLHETDGTGVAGATFSLSFAAKDPRGHFNGSLLTNEVLMGSWSNADNTESHPVYLYLIGEMRLPAGASRYSIAGADDDAVVEKNAEAFYSAVLRGNRTAAAKYVSYPLSFYVKGKQVEARNRTEFLRKYDLIFTREFRARIASSIPHNMLATSEGIMLGNGEVWFNSEGKAFRLNN
jgi:hypothetical protein